LAACSGNLAVEQRRFDDIATLSTFEHNNICMLKVDVEGREPAVIGSATQALMSGKVWLHPTVAMSSDTGEV
jgi:hypothetical protein